MQHHLINSLRLLGASLAAFAFAACVRFAPPAGYLAALEPRQADAPPASEMAAPGRAVDEQELVALLDARLEAIEAEIVNLRKVLDVLGPLPDHPDLFIPVDMAELKKPSTKASADLFQTFGTAPEYFDIRQPIRTAYDGLDTGIAVAALSEDAALNALCIELSAIAGPARAVVPIRAG